MNKPFGTLVYLINLIRYFTNWHKVLLNRLRGRNTTKVKLTNGLTITGGENSKVDDLVDEVFVKNSYTPKQLSITKGDIVIDIGANIGVFGLMAARMGAEKILEVEPFPKNTAVILKNFKNNRLHNPTIEQSAISSKVGKAKLYLGDLNSHNLLFNRNSTDDLFENYIEVPTLTLEKLFTLHKIDHCNFLKIDCEGSEGDIVYSTPFSTWKKIDKIAIEYHDNVSTFSHKDIVRKLSKLGYKIEVVVSDRYFGYIYAWR